MTDERARIQSLERENAHLRLIHQKGGCPYGHASDKGCELGYPGCACMDDILAMMAWGPEDEGKANVRLEKRLKSAEQERDRLRDLIARGYPAMLARAETAEAALNEARADVIGLERAAQERRSGDVVRLLSAALAWFHSERPQTRSGTLPLWVVDGQNALSALTSTEEG